MNIHEQEEQDFTPSTLAEIDRDSALWDADKEPDRAWLLSGRDVWYANPHYQGLPQPHPEERGDHYFDYKSWMVNDAMLFYRRIVRVTTKPDYSDCPF